MAELKVLICDWCKADGFTQLAAEVLQIRRGATPFNLALCSKHVAECMVGAVKATRGARRGVVASQLAQSHKKVV